MVAAKGKRPWIGHTLLVLVALLISGSALAATGLAKTRLRVSVTPEPPYSGVFLELSAQKPWANPDAERPFAEGSRHATKAGVSKVTDETIDLFRAVSPGEFDDIARIGGFRAAPGAFEGKQFGLSLKETLNFADQVTDAAAIMRVRIPKSVFNQLDFSKNIDSFIFKNGVITVQPGKQMELLNKSIIKLDQAF